MEDILILTALVVGLVEVAKRSFKMPSDYAFILSVVLGLGLMFLNYFEASLKDMIITGLIIGLSASGLYSGTKNTAQAIIKKK